ncbi:hypothetical protein EPUS_08920 [Endocarpon pusillum Z07020]|uniref:mRNA cap guanine-N(7) methyltransferase n=1 Tax=Endocarpon pusillum (strain Z07020 / HMAS-L-300199) TaxID=1263415 RepID=U1GC31_ENDPU|nr:uncharacterized protein EPUS_08920 [Endocarpon pusillum Z07020]ERF69241.1 hypothetical protein EPUS_08920 [Endocarpon pusillum Z07020]
MSETPSDPAATRTGRRRSSVVYDPARDVFQPAPDSLPTVTEERVQAAANGGAPEQGLDHKPHSDSIPRIPLSTMTPEIGKKRQRSPSPTSRQASSDDRPLSPPPEKKRRSSITEQSLPSGSSRIPSPPAQKLSEPSLTNSTHALKPHVDAKVSVDHSTSSSTLRQDGQMSSQGGRSPQSRSIHPLHTDRSHIDEKDDNRNDGSSQRRRSPQRRRNGERYSPAPRRSRTRSPIRRRSPKSNTRSVYGRRDPPPAPRRSRSPSPIRRSPPREEQPMRRPGGGTGRGRNVLAIAQRLAEERERQEEAQNAQIQRDRGVQQMSNQFYNARPEWVKERGRDWRKNESKIKGLRSFNNWIKSCIIQKFSPEEAPQVEELGWGEEPTAPAERKPLLVLDLGCGKGGDLGKWQLAPQTVGLYVGLDPAHQSIRQAHERYNEMRRRRKPIFDARFHVKDCFGEWVGEIPIVKEVGIDPNAGHGGPSKWSGGGFDVVTMMFSMHYAFESEQKARMMLRNVAGALKKGGRFIGVVPNSDAIAEQVVKWCRANKDKKHGGAEVTHGEANPNSTPAPNGQEATKPDQQTDESFNSPPHWGNSLYSVRFGTDRPVPQDGVFRDPPFGWKYMYWMEEAVDVPEYVVPWEAFRAVAEGFNLEQRYRKPFLEVWEAESRDRELRELAGRMGVLDREGNLGITGEEREAVAFYHAFCFVKV